MQSELIENERLHNAAQLGGTYIYMYEHDGVVILNFYVSKRVTHCL